MKINTRAKSLFYSFGFAVSLCIISLLFPPSSFKAQSVFPTEFDGIPVIFVETSSNTVGLKDGDAVIVLNDNGSKSIEESIQRLGLNEFLAKNPLPKGWSVEVYGGPTSSVSSFINGHNINNGILKNHASLGPQGNSIGVESTLTYRPFMAAFQDTDPSSQTLGGISARWFAPSLRSGWQQNPSTFLVNGETNTGYLLQAGHGFYPDGTAVNDWSSPASNLLAVPFAITYQAGHEYEFTVANGGVGFGWWMGCSDLTGVLFDYHADSSSTGDHLSATVQTCVWFENWNSSDNPSWYTFSQTNPIHAFTAKDFNGSWKNWDNGQAIGLTPSQTIVPNNGTITGTLVGGSTADWHLDKVGYAGWVLS